jgi:hypothetical protein
MKVLAGDDRRLHDLQWFRLQPCPASGFALHGQPASLRLPMRLLQAEDKCQGDSNFLNASNELLLNRYGVSAGTLGWSCGFCCELCEFLLLVSDKGLRSMSYAGLDPVGIEYVLQLLLLMLQTVCPFSSPHTKLQKLNE